MMMMTKKIFWLILLFFPSILTFSQPDDFGLWYGLNAEYKILKRIEIDGSVYLRTYHNASEISEAYFEGGLTYKFNKFLSAAASYRYSIFHDKDDSFNPRHKLFADIKGTLPVNNFILSARFRFQERYKTYFLDQEDRIPDSHLRFKLKLLYNIPSFPVNPYIASEIFCPLFTTITRHIDKARYMTGAEYNISKNHLVEVGYMFQRDYLPHISDINLITLAYTFKF